MPDGYLDPDEWSADIADLFCEISAVVRLAASVAHGENEIRVPAVRPGTSPQYLDQPSVTDPGEEQETAESKEKPAAGVGQQRLRPRENELAWKVVVPNRLARDVAEDPTLAWAIKEDIARSLALMADRAFLNGGGGDDPLGIGSTSGVFAPAGGTPFEIVRQMVTQLRTRPLTFFRRPGWVLSPSILDRLAQEVIGAGRTLDSTRLLTLDGEDGGVLLGYPFVATEAADDRTYFSADWREAWIGVDREFVRVDISTDTAFQSDETVVRAVMHHDFLVRRPGSFIHIDPIPAA
jgi:HK97 family phage major capsid protein